MMSPCLLFRRSKILFSESGASMSGTWSFYDSGMDSMVRWHHHGDMFYVVDITTGFNAG